MWKTREAGYVPPWQSRNPGPGRGNYTGWQLQRAPYPMDRSLGEAAMSSLGIRPSGYIQRSSMREVNGELERLKEERQALEAIREALERQEKKLVLLVHRLDLAEKKLGETVGEIDEKFGELDDKLRALSALTSHIEAFIEDLRRRARVPGL